LYLKFCLKSEAEGLLNGIEVSDISSNLTLERFDKKYNHKSRTIVFHVCILLKYVHRVTSSPASLRSTNIKCQSQCNALKALHDPVEVYDT